MNTQIKEVSYVRPDAEVIELVGSAIMTVSENTEPLIDDDI